jgi:hypothetical protein
MFFFCSHREPSASEASSTSWVLTDIRQFRTSWRRSILRWPRAIPSRRRSNVQIPQGSLPVTGQRHFTFMAGSGQEFEVPGIWLRRGDLRIWQRRSLSLASPRVSSSRSLLCCKFKGGATVEQIAKAINWQMRVPGLRSRGFVQLGFEVVSVKRKGERTTKSLPERCHRRIKKVSPHGRPFFVMLSRLYQARRRVREEWFPLATDTSRRIPL